MLFEQEDIGEPGKARDFLMNLGADPADQAIVDPPGRRWQCRVEDVGLIAGPLDA